MKSNKTRTTKTSPLARTEQQHETNQWKPKRTTSEKLEEQQKDMKITSSPLALHHMAFIRGKTGHLIENLTRIRGEHKT